MVNVRPNIDPAARYSVTEACAILAIHRNTLNRYFERYARQLVARLLQGRKSFDFGTQQFSFIYLFIYSIL